MNTFKRFPLFLPIKTLMFTGLFAKIIGDFDPLFLIGLYERIPEKHIRIFFDIYSTIIVIYHQKCSSFSMNNVRLYLYLESIFMQDSSYTISRNSNISFHIFFHCSRNLHIYPRDSLERGSREERIQMSTLDCPTQFYLERFFIGGDGVRIIFFVQINIAKCRNETGVRRFEPQAFLRVV